MNTTDNIFYLAPPNAKIAIVYNQKEHDYGYKIEKRFGANSIVSYDNGIVDYEQIEFVTSKAEATERINILRQISNRTYTDFKVVAR